MHKARENYVKAEASDKIMNSLRHKVRSYAEEEYECGEKVLYQASRGRKGWRGPATVLGKEGNYVLIRHGNAHDRCHPCHLLKLPKVGEGLSQQKPNASKISGDSVEKESKEDDTSDEENNDEGEAADSLNNESEGDDKSKEENVNDEEGIENVEDDSDAEIEIGDETRQGEETSSGIVSSVSSDQIRREKSKKIRREESEDEDDNSYEGPLQNPIRRPKPHTFVEFMNRDGNLKKAKVLSYELKRSGKSGNWLNVKYVGADELRSVNLMTIQWWRQLNTPYDFRNGSSTKSNGCQVQRI